MSVDPLVEEYPSWSPYAYTMLNPVKYIDPDGTSTGVKDNGDGTYTIVSGNADDGNRGIYIVDDDGYYDIESSDKLANSITTHSFFDKNDKVVKGAVIDMNSTEGQNFLDQVKTDDPSLLSYMWNATNDQKYDFKAEGKDERGENMSVVQHFYRGSVSSNGDVGSARDYGNMGAGMVAARKGLSWQKARAGFDMYQGYKSNGITTLPTPGPIKGSGGIPIPTILPKREATTTVKAQMVGFARGWQRYQ